MTETLTQLATQKKIFWTLVGIILLCAGFYMYSVTTTIRNTVARQTLEKQAAQLTFDLGSQEFAFINLQNNITLSYAYSLGFTDVTAKNFISRTSPEPSEHMLSYLSR